MRVNAIETLHAMWADACTMHRFLDQIAGDRPVTEGATYSRKQTHIWANSAQLRPFILSHQHSDGADLGDEFARNFLPNAEAPASFPSTILYAPLAIANWRWQSGRVYQVNDELQEVLLQTSIERFTWDDLGVPFPAYAVHCAVPLRDDDGRLYSDIIVSEYVVGSDKVVDIWLVPQEYKRLSNLKLQSMQACLRRKDIMGLLKRTMDIGAEIERANGVLFTLPATTMLKSVVDARQKRKSLLSQVLRVAGGLAVYLQTLPANSQHIRHQGERVERKSAASDVVRCISDSSEVFDITSSIELKSPAAPIDYGDACEHRAGVSPSPHWREAHWRRNPGMGHDPMAKKVVHVRRALVLSDKLPRGALPIAASKTLH